MKLLTSYSLANEILFGNYFLPTFPEKDRLLAKRLPGGGDSEYGSPAWEAGVLGKVQHVADYLMSEQGPVEFALADADIQFFPSFSLDRLSGLLAESGCDILYQREFGIGGPPGVNTGFYVARATSCFRDFFSTVQGRLKHAARKSDQTIVNALLPDSKIKWGYLPWEYYARTQGFPPPEGSLLHHANGTKANSLRRKMRQLHCVRCYLAGGFPGRIQARIEKILFRL